MKQIDVDTLRGWLEEGRELSVVDVRPAAERAEWSIPGSRHVDAYEALKKGEAGPLATLAVAADRPIVTVCARGKTSAVAARELSERGLEVYSLAGGMKAWSLAWNTAAIDLSGGTRVVQVRRTGKGCLSYAAGRKGEAVVIDPALAPEVYREIAAAEGWRIVAVIETHVHADHLSRARALAQISGCPLYLPRTDRVAFAHTPVDDGQKIEFAGETIECLRTPGHTAESTCYLLTGALFTGDTIFLNAVGRPDLKAGGTDEARERARLLYGSLGRLRALDPNIVVLPGHTSTPVAFDGVPLAGRLGDRLAAIDRRYAGEEQFIEQVAGNLPETPPNFTQIVELNEAGELPDNDPTDLEAGANRCAGL